MQSSRPLFSAHNCSFRVAEMLLNFGIILDENFKKKRKHQLVLTRFKFRWLCKKCKKKNPTLCSLKGFLQVCNTLALIPMESTSSIIPLFSSLQTKPVLSWLLVCSVCSTMCVQITRLILSSLRGTVRVKLQSYPHTVMWPPTNQPASSCSFRENTVYMKCTIWQLPWSGDVLLLEIWDIIEVFLLSTLYLLLRHNYAILNCHKSY